jgi:DNA-binding transcriptional LysR family regulator
MVVARNHEPVGTLRIVAPVVFGLHNLAPVLQSYTENFPKVVPDLTLVDRQVDLVEEGSTSASSSRGRCAARASSRAG